MNDEFDPMDSLIDRALTSYTPREPRLGLEQRVLSSIAAETSQTHSRFQAWKPVWRWAAAASLLAVAIVPVWIELVQPRIGAVQHPAIAGAGHLPPAVPVFPAVANPVQNTRTARQAATDPDMPRTPSRSNFEENTPLAGASSPDESLATEAIELKPITIAPIRIRELN